MNPVLGRKSDGTTRLVRSNPVNFRATHDVDAARDLDGNMCYKWPVGRECLLLHCRQTTT